MHVLASGSSQAQHNAIEAIRNLSLDPACCRQVFQASEVACTCSLTCLLTLLWSASFVPGPSLRVDPQVSNWSFSQAQAVCQVLQIMSMIPLLLWSKSNSVVQRDYGIESSKCRPCEISCKCLTCTLYILILLDSDRPSGIQCTCSVSPPKRSLLCRQMALNL